MLKSVALDKKTSSWNRRYFFYYQLPAAWVVHRKQWNNTKGKKVSCARLSLFLLRAAATLKNWQSGNQTLSFVLPAFSNTLFTLSELGHSRYLFLLFQCHPFEQKLLVSLFQIKLRVCHGTALPVLPCLPAFSFPPSNKCGLFGEGYSVLHHNTEQIFP